MLRLEKGYFEVTEKGKKEFALHSTASRSNFIMLVVGAFLIALTFWIKWQIIPEEAVAFFGVILIFCAILFQMLSKRNEPKLPLKARVLLREISRENQ